jgi:hypothetical protein
MTEQGQGGEAQRDFVRTPKDEARLAEENQRQVADDRETKRDRLLDEIFEKDKEVLERLKDT